MGFAVVSILRRIPAHRERGLLLFYRAAMHAAHSSVIGPRPGKAEPLRASCKDAHLVDGRGGGDAREGHSQERRPKFRCVQQRLIRAGLSQRIRQSKFFYGSKVLVIAGCAAVVSFTGLAASSPFIIYIAAAMGLGYLAPDFWLGRKIRSRQTRIRLGLPDVLDLLVICVEAGLGMDQATARTAHELRIGASPSGGRDELEHRGSGATRRPSSRGSVAAHGGAHRR